MGVWDWGVHGMGMVCVGPLFPDGTSELLHYWTAGGVLVGSGGLAPTRFMSEP
eukprot:NODE_10389_length_195_cov_29.773973_g10306_i0.p2 GENE.NODE_10389_length_195_cov_29.773973_g10306_i0~~NODE_10389_length_195_cov_29.773973_g10306_i0.p2  ORF type:complete len:60 (+),score=16.65 NODE_10389_length_195_cov_29.773973_g10306_i0:24-182(+)